MMGLVGNVAEVKHLRNRLMKSEFITVFSNLLDSDSDGIEVRLSQRTLIEFLMSERHFGIFYLNFFRSAIMRREF